MRNLQRLIFSTTLLALVCTPSFTLADDWPPRHNPDVTVSGAAFTALGLNTPRTFDAIDVPQYSTAIVEVQYTYNAATHVTMTCEQSPDSTATVPKWFKISELEDMGSGVLDHYQRTWRWVTGSASANFVFEVPIRFNSFRCTISSVSGNANDKATVTVTIGGLQ